MAKLNETEPFDLKDTQEILDSIKQKADENWKEAPTIQTSVTITEDVEILEPYEVDEGYLD